MVASCTSRSGAVLFADSSQVSAVPEDASSEAEGGVRLHGVRSVERADTVQALKAQRRIHASLAARPCATARCTVAQLLDTKRSTRSVVNTGQWASASGSIMSACRNALSV
jgi:hypothetical protein